MEGEGSLQPAQQPAIGPYALLDYSGLFCHNHLPLKSILVIPSHLTRWLRNGLPYQACRLYFLQISFLTRNEYDLFLSLQIPPTDELLQRKTVLAWQDESPKGKTSKTINMFPVFGAFFAQILWLLFWWLNGEGEGLSVCLSVCDSWFLLDIYDWDDQIKIILKQTQMLIVDQCRWNHLSQIANTQPKAPPK